MVLWMVLIFCFSARDGGTSEQDSYHIGIVAGRILVPGFSEWTEEKQTLFAEKVDHPIRKTAHAMEYAILGMLILGAYMDGEKSRMRCMCVSWSIATAYAATDEFHQLFVSGRSGQLTDVMIDSSGALAGVLVIFMIFLTNTSKNSPILYRWLR
ncbi:MAG: VanZ family protein [Hespellia sp.]|nr:VanZ family protein [Hespellia sp.]